MSNQNDLAIYLKILIENNSKSNIVTETDKLIQTLQQKLNKITIAPTIKLPTTANISDIVNKINKLLSARIEASVNLKNINLGKSGNIQAPVSTQNTQIVKELDGTVKKYTETVKKNGEVIQKTTEIIDKNKITKQQSASSQVVNNINKETDAVEKLNSEYGKLIRTVKLKKANGDPLRQDQTYLNSQTGVKTTVTSRPNQENIYRTDSDFGAKKNADALKEQMKLARESAKIAKQSNDYHQSYYKVQQKAFDDNNKEYLRGVKLREKADLESEKNRQKYIQNRVKQMQQEQKQQQITTQNNVKLMRQEAEARLKYYTNSQKIKGTDFNAENAEYLRGVKLREKAEQDAQKIKQKQIQDSVKLLQQEQKEREKSEQNYIKSLRQTAEEKLRLHQTSVKLIDQENAEYLRGIKLREAEQQKFIVNQERINKQLNTKTQNALGLGVKFNNLSPEQLAPLEKALNRYKTLINSMQQKNISGQVVSDKDLERLSRLENAIKRVYDQTRIASKDSRGFNFEQYPKMQNAVHGATNAQNYYNQSIMHGKKLLEANIQETEKYIKVTQRLRDGSKITNVTAYVNKLTGETHKFSESMKDLMTRTWDVGSAFKTALQKIQLWAGATGLVYGFINGLKQMGKEIIEIDTKLTELSKVLDNNTDWSKLMEDTAESANKMARSLTEALDAEIEFAKQGFEAIQAVELARTAMLGANVTGLKTSEMANYLTGALAQFNIEAEKSSTIIDKLNEVDNNFAVTSIGLAQSINKAGEAAQQYGVDINSLIGYTTAIQTATRESGNQIGNMLKTVFSRINMDKTQEQLVSLGIAVKDVTGNLLPLNSIYQSVATKWDAMSRAERTATAEALSGRHHITRLMALFDNWNIVTDATATAQTSLGSAIEENYKHLNSLESKINLNKAAFQEFSYALGESGVKGAMIAVLGVIAQYINGFTELTQNYNGVVTATSILGTALILLIPKIKLEYTNWILRNNLVATAIPLNHRLAISYTMLGNMIKGATVSLIAFSKAMLKNPLTWIIVAITAIPMFLGHLKQVREEQEQLNRTYEETKKKLDEILEKTNKIGQTSLQDINDIDATVKKLDELKNKLQEINQEHRSGAFGFQSASVKDLSKELKDLAAQMGINITQYHTVDEVLEAIKEKQDELSGSIGNAKDNSTEYQKTLIDQASNQTKVADNNVKLIDTYQELSNKSNLTAEEQKKLNDITAILTQSYPHLIDAKGDTITISNKVIEAIRKEAQQQKKTADENEKATKRQIISNRGKLQDQIKTSLGIIKSLSGEITALQALNNAKIDTDYLSEAQVQNTLDRMQGKNTPYSSGVDILLGEIKSPNSTKLNALRNKYKEEKNILKEAYDSIASIDDALSSSISDLTQSTKDSADSSNSTSEAKSAESLAWEKVTNNIKSYDNALKSLEDTTSNMIKGSKARRDSLHAENLKIKEQIEYLKQQRSGLNSTSASSNSNVYTPTSTGKAKGILDIALDSLGTPYKWGGNDLKIGVDCSGLVQQAYREEGVSVPRVTYDQYKQAPIKGLKQNELQPGDLVFFNNLAHVGIYMGNDKFIEAPRTGLNVRTSTLSSRSDYYAGARYLSGEGTSLVTSSSNSNLTYEKLAEDRIKHQEEINAKILELEKKFAENSKEWYTDLWSESDNIINEFEQKSNFSKMFSESMSKSSPKYREQLDIQKNSTIGIQKQLAEQAKQMDQAIENMKKGIIEGTFKDEQFLNETIEKRKALSAEWWNKQKEIIDKQAEITSSEVEELTYKIDKYNNIISISQAQQEMNEKGSIEYNNALKDEVIQYTNIASALKAKQVIYQKELADTLVGTLRYEELQRAISDTTKEIIDNEKALYNKKISIADDIISIYKDTYEKQKDYALDAIDEQIKAEEDRHEQAIKNIEDETKQYEDSINEKLALLDKQANQEDYTKDLTKLQKEEAEIKKKIDVLALDDRHEANAKRIDLQKELTSKQEEIEELQTNRSRELRKENLEDQLDAYKKDNDAKKDSEDDKYDTIKDNLDDQKEITEKYYENLINDERKFAQIREDIIKGNFSNIQNELSNFESIASSKFKSLGTNIQTNFINQIKNALSALQSFNDASGADIGGSSGSSSNNSGSNNSSNHSQYYPWKSQINNIIYDKKMWQQGYETGNQQMMRDAENEAKIYYDQIPDNIKSLLQGMDYTSAKSWYDSNVYHEGDVVGGSVKGSRIANIIDKLFNKGQNEQISKLLNGEVVLSKRGIDNFVPMLQNMVSSFTLPSFNLQPQGAGGLKIDSLLTINGNVDRAVMPQLEDLVNKTANKVAEIQKKNLNMSGIFRRV